jgi:hypothetical protein
MTGGTPCTGTPVAIGVSGWTATSCPGYYDSITQIEQFNGTHDAVDLCGRAGFTQNLDRDDASLFYTGVMTLTAGLARQSFVSNSHADPGFVKFQIKIGVLLQNLSGVSIRYSGSYESTPLSIESLSPQGQWLRGRTANVSCTGAGDLTGMFIEVCDLPTQTISVSFQ